MRKKKNNGSQTSGNAEEILRVAKDLCRGSIVDNSV